MVAFHFSIYFSKNFMTLEILNPKVINFLLGTGKDQMVARKVVYCICKMLIYVFSLKISVMKFFENIDPS